MSLQRDVDLSRCNTLGLPATAEWYAEIDSAEALKSALAFARERGLICRVLGGGSNLWLPPRVAGLTLRVALRGCALLEEDADAWYVSAAGGENWHEFVQWTISQGWPGLENLSLIPGTAGAAPVQNIGAYGVELKDFCHSVSAYRLDDASMRRFTVEECCFAYRDSVFKQAEAGRWMISEVVFRLPKAWQGRLDYGEIRTWLDGQSITPAAVADAVMAIRSRKLPDPATLGNAGSFFQNPVIDAEHAGKLRRSYPDMVAYPLANGMVKLAAGWLIERTGWKGRRLGTVGMYERQALVLVNHGGATSDDVAALVACVQVDVMTKFGVVLTAEPIRWLD